ncbi:Protein-S-isoprenylcysteine O-methyltransferase B [Vitis vinifera]|uniref:Protein-S-isoprenylcysteine O-methyltransferase B n=1 Tax=Vitis vinifera TaxID=29760 RepID=A0A438CJG1_VITVI|nr:Protein-S-isoprenylcysteine O-methyltransferase B [Vitis vinifera]
MTENFSYTACRQLSQMFLAILFFHSSEYVIAVNIHGRSNVTLKSLLISKAYLLAMVCSLLEYFAEIVLFPGLKEIWWISNSGLAMVIMLCNPISTIAFAIIVWHFFYKRIPYEEFFLRQFFGSEYEEYAQLVPSGVPFVK